MRNLFSSRRLRAQSTENSATVVSGTSKERAQSLAEDLYSVIVPRRGVSHDAIAQENIPKKGLPCIKQSALDTISTQEYVRMVAPVIRYLTTETRSGFVEQLLSTRDKNVRRDAISQLADYQDSFDQIEWRKLGGHVTPASSLNRLPRHHYGDDYLENSTGDISSSTTFPAAVFRLRNRYEMLKNHEPTYRVGDWRPNQKLRAYGQIASELHESIARYERTPTGISTVQNGPNTAAQPLSLTSVENLPRPPAYSKYPDQPPAYSVIDTVINNGRFPGPSNTNHTVPVTNISEQPVSSIATPDTHDAQVRTARSELRAAERPRSDRAR